MIRRLVVCLFVLGASVTLYGQYRTLCRGCTVINVGDTWQTVINAGSAGDRFLIKAGTHRLQTVAPKNNQTFVGEIGAIQSGAALLSSWTFDGANSRWYVTGQTQAGSIVGTCFSGYPVCDHPEDLYVDNVVVIPVANLVDGVPGRWFFDYSADRIYVWNDPSGHVVETTVTPQAFTGSATGVLIRGLTIEKFANPAQSGAIAGGVGWEIYRNEVRYNHGIGVGMANARTVSGNTIHHNGQMGIGGTGNSSTVSYNEVSYNNTVGFDSYWEAGGSKFTFSDGLITSHNYFHHNRGPGIWYDIDNIHSTIEYNQSDFNAQSGIFYEISEDAVIRYNTLTGNGTQPPIAFWADGGILVSTSRNVQVYGNYLADNWQNICGLDEDRGSGTYGTRSLDNMSVHDNSTVSYTDLGGGSGLTGIFGNLSASTSKGNTYDYNTYVHNTAHNQFAYLEDVRASAYWTGTATFDTHGTISSTAPAAYVVNSAVGGDVTGASVAIVRAASFNVTTGNTLVAFVRHDTGLLTSTSFFDSAGNTFTRRGEANLGASDRVVVYEAANVIGSTTDVVWMEFSNPVAYAEIAVVQIGNVLVNPFDVLVTNGNGTGTTLTSGAFTTTQATELIIMAGSVDALAQTFTQGAGYTKLLTTTGGTMAVQYKVVSAIQTAVTASMTVGSSANWELIGATFKQR